MMTMKFCLAVVIGIALATAVHGCFQNVYTDSSSFNIDGNGKAIIFDSQFSCSGDVTELKYYVSVPASGSDKQYFSVWKPKPGGSGDYELKDRVALTGNTIGEHTQTLSPVIQVENNYVMGLYMSANVTSSPVPYATDANPPGWPTPPYNPYGSGELVRFAEDSQKYNLAKGHIWQNPFGSSTEKRMASLRPVV